MRPTFFGALVSVLTGFRRFLNCYFFYFFFPFFPLRSIFCEEQCDRNNRLHGNHSLCTLLVLNFTILESSISGEGGRGGIFAISKGRYEKRALNFAI